jgi:CubicO group peptidase (beta-lactamase class C family)
MSAVSRGRLGLNDSIGRFFPAPFIPRDKKDITVEHLLNHCSGLPPHEPFYGDLIALPASERSTALLQRILATPLLASPGRASHYSDLGFMLLGFLLASALDSPWPVSLGFWPRVMASWVPQGNELLYVPLKVESDPARPPERLCEETLSFVATERCPWRNRLLQGEVHDENAYCMGGIAPHAGLFGTAESVFHLLSYLWGVYRGSLMSSSLHRDVVEAFWQKGRLVAGSTWALGFDTPSSRNSSAGDRFSPRSIGHLGFTGTSFWLDLDQELLVVLLTNRVYPSRSNEKLKAFRPLLHNRVMESFYEYSKHGR